MEYLDVLEDIAAWEQRPDEPGHIYAAFECYRLLGPGRSIPRAYVDFCQQYKETQRERPPSNWYQWKREYEWDSRVQAWDKAQRVEKRQQHAVAIETAQQRNRAALDAAIDNAEAVLKLAKQGSDQQRLWTDTLLRLTAERRKEYGYDVTRVEQVEPLEVIDVPWPEDHDDAG